MNTSLMLPLEGPSISGVVEVPLAELDKMRVNHANAVRMVEEMKEKRQMVWCTITTSDDKVEEKLTDWKNLDEVEGSIQTHLDKQYNKRIDKLNDTIQEKNMEIGRKDEAHTIYKEEIVDERKAWQDENREQQSDIQKLKVDKELCLVLSHGKSNLLDKRHRQVMDLLREKVILLKTIEVAEEALVEKGLWYALRMTLTGKKK